VARPAPTPKSDIMVSVADVGSRTSSGTGSLPRTFSGQRCRRRRDTERVRVAFFSTHPFDRQSFDEANAAHRHDLHYFDARLSPTTSVLAQGFPAVCAFVNDRLDATVLTLLSEGETRMIALRSAGFNHVDVRTARDLGLTVSRVPAYSPHAVAEHTVALMLALNRKIHRAYARVREGNFALDGLLGFDLVGRTSGSLAPAR
jgi:D-lactate dehydrogenase